MISSLRCYSLKDTYPQNAMIFLLGLMASEMPSVASRLFPPPLKVLKKLWKLISKDVWEIPFYFLLIKQHWPISSCHSPGKHLLTLWWIGSVCTTLLSFPLPVFFIPRLAQGRFSTALKYFTSSLKESAQEQHVENSRITTHEHWGSCQTK